MKRVRHTDIEEEEGNVEEEEQERPPKKEAENLYDPFCEDPTPLAIRHCRRKQN